MDQSDSRSIPELQFEKSAGCEIASRARCIVSILTVHKADKITKADFKSPKRVESTTLSHFKNAQAVSRKKVARTFTYMLIRLPPDCPIYSQVSHASPMAADHSSRQGNAISPKEIRQAMRVTNKV
jgi:hypothetical protein